MRGLLLALVVVVSGCSSSATVAALSAPEPLSIQLTADGRFTHGDISGDLAIFGSDADRISLGVSIPDGEGIHRIETNAAALIFRDDDLDIKCNSFSGTVERMRSEIRIKATCVNDPLIAVIASYPSITR